MFQSPLVFQVFTFLIRMSLVLTLPGQIKLLSPACVQWYKEMGAEISVSKRNLSVLQVLLQNREGSDSVVHSRGCDVPITRQIHKGET